MASERAKAVLDSLGINAGLVVQMLTILGAFLIAFQALKSDVRSTREELSRTRDEISTIRNDVSALRVSMPSGPVYELKMHVLENEQARQSTQLDTLQLLLQKTRDQLLAKGILH